MVMGGCKGVLESVKTVRRCDNHQGSERCKKGMSVDVEV